MNIATLIRKKLMEDIKTKTIIEKFDELFYNVPAKWMNRTDIVEFIQSELNRIAERVIGEEMEDEWDDEIIGYNKKRQEIINILRVEGIIK
jgi:hypothetical protein